MTDVRVLLPVGDDPPSGRLIYGTDVREGLRKLGPASIHMVATSPPYWGLRDYGVAPSIWGGDAVCPHQWEGQVITRKGEATGRLDMQFRLVPPGDGKTNKPGATTQYRKDRTDTCSLCGAWRGQLGLEPTPDAYVEHMVDVFREVRRVLRDDGVVWLNLGDSFANHPSSATNRNGMSGTLNAGKTEFQCRTQTRGTQHRREIPEGLKPKDLVGIPWRVALALQADGWWLRNAVIWHKRNPMPSPVQDRLNTTYEQVFLLTKSARYFFDLDAIREPHTFGSYDDEGSFTPGQTWNEDQGLVRKMDLTTGQLGTMAGPPRRYGRGLYNPGGKNPGDMWSIPTQPFPGAHFACVDDETECLTVEGWKPRRELRVGMLAAQFDMEKGVLSWAPIDGVAQYDVVEQEMVTVRGRDIDMVLTPNHRTIISRRHPRSRQRQQVTIVEASELLPSHAIPVSAPWQAEETDTNPFEEGWAELIGWYLAEGHAGRSAEVAEIYQSRSANPIKVERIRELLDAVNADYTIAECDRTWHAKPDRMVAFQIRGFANVRLRQWVQGKRLHKGVLVWPRKLRERLLKGLILGDGHRRCDDNRASFIQKDKETADTVHALGVSLGYAVHMTQKRGVWTVFFTDKRLIGLGGAGGRSSAVGRSLYTGVVWCPKLPHGTWVARRGGRAFITGNTWPQAIPERCILSGTSAFGCCGRCGSPWRRVVERTDSQGNSSPDGGPKAAASQAKREAGGVGRLDGGRRSAEGSTFHNNPSKRKHPGRKFDGWEPSCRCRQAGLARSVVLDPFSGSGTTGQVALRLGRDYIGLDLNEDYLPMAVARLRDDPIPDAPAPPPKGSVMDVFGMED